MCDALAVLELIVPAINSALKESKATVMRFSSSPWLLGPFMFVLASGCSGDGFYSVSGTVKLESGEPLPNAFVTFTPVDDSGQVANASIATGQTDEDGWFELTTMSPGDGAYAGTYKVTVIESDPDQPESSDNVDLEDLINQPETPFRSVVHENYTMPSATPLVHEVPASGSVAITLKKDGT